MKRNSVPAGVKTPPSYREFVVLVTLLIALTAFSIDAMLPALPEIGRDLRVENANDRQLVITTIFIGLAGGQLFFGPLSDSIGRKPAIYIGLLLFMAGTVQSMLAPTFTVMLLGRLLQGVGASGPRAVTLAVVRDRFSGRSMARVMSFVMTVFILIHMFAPSLGQAVLGAAGWRAIFGLILLLAAVAMTWFAIRQPETLAPADRAPFTGRGILRAARLVVGNRPALGYTVAAGLVSGAFVGYLNSAQQIFQEQYALGELFPVYFGAIGSSIGVATLVNSRLVVRLGMRLLVRNSLIAILVLSAAALGGTLLSAEQLPLGVFVAYLAVTFFAFGVLFGNLNSLAMEPLGKVAGIGAAVVGALSTLISALLGGAIGQSYNGTTVPLLLGLAILPGLSLWVMRRVEG